MSLNLRIFLAYFLIVGVAFYILLNVSMSELKPGIRQSTEDTLVDMSNLLAEVVSDEFLENKLNQPQFGKSVGRFIKRVQGAKIFSVEKSVSNLRIYITDDMGIVRYDSDDQAVGQDYSKWNDVYLTLQGKYGARSSEAEPGNAFSTVMYVAAPIKNGEQIAGVLTVAKPNWSVQPFIDKAKDKIQLRGLALLIISLFVAIILSYWLTASIRRLASYADKIAQGERAVVPKVRESELAKLAGSIDNMRRNLEGKEYVERYVHALTHELKSPVSAIKGASEIINPSMPEKDISRFMNNIQYEIKRMDEMINRLLALAEVEKRDVLEQLANVDLLATFESVLESKKVQCQKKKLDVKTNFPNNAVMLGDSFLLTQALDNILQNAIDFSPENGSIEISIALDQQNALVVSVKDQGTGIPEYALNKVFDRFYSLTRPDTQKKSSGLGLCFVKQIVGLHSGIVLVKNHADGGVIATLTLPQKNKL